MKRDGESGRDRQGLEMEAKAQIECQMLDINFIVRFPFSKVCERFLSVLPPSIENLTKKKKTQKKI